MDRPKETFNIREIFVTRDGQTRSASEWAKELKINKNTVRKRAERGLLGEDLIAPAQPRFGYAHAARRAAKAAGLPDAGA